MAEESVGYPIGEQDFKSLREMECIYIDKTDYIEKIINGKNKYYFLARPRRFGKSLFLSTLRYFFEGRRELFKGLYIDTTDWDWEPYPVLKLDFNTDRYEDQGRLGEVLGNQFREWEEEYDVTTVADSLSVRFRNIIKAAHDKTGRQVVILVDEYDKPLVGNLNKDDNFEHYRSQLASVYSNFKSSAEHIRLVFLTGVSRFSKLSVFSDLNNIKDITFNDAFADICGITERELLGNFRQGIQRLAEKYTLTYDEAVAELKANYDGYRFTPDGSDIYNPWSVLNAMADSSILNYWTLTGTPTIIAESLRNTNKDLRRVLNIRCRAEDILGLDMKTADPVALMYQTGYLTIKDYDVRSRMYTLGIPNREVRENLFEVLVPYYVTVRYGTTLSTVRDIINCIDDGEPEELMRNLQAYFAGIPYDLHLENENNFQNAIYILLTLIGVIARVEEHTSDGRIDIIIEAYRYVYIIELKYDRPAEEALRQIEEKQYARKYQTDHRKVFCIGVEFSSKTRRLENFIINNSTFACGS